MVSDSIANFFGNFYFEVKIAKIWPLRITGMSLNVQNSSKTVSDLKLKKKILGKICPNLALPWFPFGPTSIPIQNLTICCSFDSKFVL